MKFILKAEKDEHPEMSYGSGEYIDLIPSKLVKLFGQPEEADQYKVSGTFRFLTPNGGEIYINDWKATSLYDEEYPSPEELWGSNKDFSFNIGHDNKGKEYLKDFITFLNSLKNNSTSFIFDENDYEILKVKKDASLEEIKKAYHTMAKKYHPDRGGREYNFKIIKQAYERLGG